MADLTRPVGISDDSWGRLQNLYKADNEAALDLVSRYTDPNGAISNSSAFDRDITASLVRFGRITAADSGLNASAARFGNPGNVIPLRRVSDPLTRDEEALVASMDAYRGPLVPEVRPGFIDGITKVVSG